MESFSPANTLKIEIVPQANPDIKLIKLSGPLTIQNFFEFQAMARQKPLPKWMFVDISDVPYMDSAALGSLVGIHVSCDGTSRKYALIGASSRLKSLFEVTNTDSFLVLKETLAEAEALVS